jgi:predicted dehydrogenase
VGPEVGGPSRAFADIGSHWCDLVEWVAGERFIELHATSIAAPNRPQAGGPTFSGAHRGLGGADVADRGRRPRLGHDSQVAAGRKNPLWFALDGSLGSAVFDQENPETVWLGRQEGGTTLFRDAAHRVDATGNARRTSSTVDTRAGSRMGGGGSREALEVACWPSTGGRDLEAGHLPVAEFGERQVEETHASFQRHSLSPSALAYYENNLHPDPARREEIHTHLRHSIVRRARLDEARCGQPGRGRAGVPGPGRLCRERGVRIARLLHRAR